MAVRHVFVLGTSNIKSQACSKRLLLDRSYMLSSGMLAADLSQFVVFCPYGGDGIPNSRRIFKLRPDHGVIAAS